MRSLLDVNVLMRYRMPLILRIARRGCGSRNTARADGRRVPSRRTAVCVFWRLNALMAIFH